MSSGTADRLAGGTGVDAVLIPKVLKGNWIGRRAWAKGRILYDANKEVYRACCVMA